MSSDKYDSNVSRARSMASELGLELRRRENAGLLVSEGYDLVKRATGKTVSGSFPLTLDEAISRCVELRKKRSLRPMANAAKAADKQPGVGEPKARGQRS